MTQTNLNLTKLWEGAVETTIDSSFESLDTVIDVPPHQEIFSTKDGQVLIFEINHVLKSDDITQDYFNDYALCQSSEFSHLDVATELSGEDVCSELHESLKSNNYSLYFCGGTQWLKHPPSSVTGVAVSLGILRLPEVDTDFVIIWNVPIPGLISIEELRQNEMRVYDRYTSVCEDVRPNFLAVINSIKIIDWKFFKTNNDNLGEDN